MEHNAATNPPNPPPAVKESSPARVTALVAQLADAGRSAGFAVGTMGESDGVPLIALTKPAAGGQPQLYLSAGIHGDEPAPPQALLRLLRQGYFDGRAAWHICPLLNPTGMARGTRENGSGRDLNRDYRLPESGEIRAHVTWLRRQPRFDLTLCLHEDWESTGFYLYELNPDRRPSLAESMIEAVRTVCPIDPAPVIDGRPAAGGIIRPDGDPAKRELWPEAIYLHAHHTRLAYTLETPSAHPLPRRIAAHVAAVTTACDRLLSAA